MIRRIRLIYFMKRKLLFLTLGALLCVSSASAQWLQETYALKGGMNAIYLSGEAKADAIGNVGNGPADIIGNIMPVAVTEVWLWSPNPTQVQFIESPLIPSSGTPEWQVWKRGLPAQSNLNRLPGQTAYLVRCTGTSSTNHSVIIKQSPQPPANSWVRNGANLLGFPSKAGSGAATFATYFSTFPAAIAANTKVFQYVGGELGPNNPQQVFSTALLVDRTKAYWFSSEVVGNFYAPLEMSLSTNNGFAFGRTGSVITARIRNRTGANVTVTLTPADSVAAPATQTAITGSVPLVLRTTGTLGITETDISLGAPVVQVIGANSSVELSIGIKRSLMTAGGDAALFGSFLRVTDSGNLMDVYLPVSAQKSVLSGLWVGDISVTNVSSQVTNSAKATATVTNGVVTSVAIKGTGGFGYTTPPVVTIAPPVTQVTATATALRSGGLIVSITPVISGSGYVVAPTVTVAPPTTGTTATATAVIRGGAVSSITVVTSGSGYTANPVITLSAPPQGTPATATAAVAGGSVTGVTITAGGSGYAISSPDVTIAAPPPLIGTSTPSPFTLRTLLHVASDVPKTTRLLSQVFLGELAATPGQISLCTQESLLKSTAGAKATAQRLVAAHLPLDLATSTGTGSVAIPGALTRTITLPYTDPTNPFVHQYHPDHDNKAPRALPSDQLLDAGVESYDVARTCTFTFTTLPPGSSTTPSGWGSSVIGGTYRETITGLHRQTLQVDGTFELRRASEDGVLVVP